MSILKLTGSLGHESAWVQERTTKQALCNWNVQMKIDV